MLVIFGLIIVNLVMFGATQNSSVAETTTVEHPVWPRPSPESYRRKFDFSFDVFDREEKIYELWKTGNFTINEHYRLSGTFKRPENGNPMESRKNLCAHIGNGSVYWIAAIVGIVFSCICLIYPQKINDPDGKVEEGSTVASPIRNLDERR